MERSFKIFKEESIKKARDFDIKLFKECDFINY